MRYEVINLFTDVQDNGYEYKVGDEYPRKGLKPTEARIRELKGTSNLRGIALIREVAEEVMEVKEAEVEPKKAKAKKVKK